MMMMMIVEIGLPIQNPDWQSNEQHQRSKDGPHFSKRFFGVTKNRLFGLGVMTFFLFDHFSKSEVPKSIENRYEIWRLLLGFWETHKFCIALFVTLYKL